MLSFSESSPTAGSVGIDPRRVDHLLGEPPSWRCPTLLCVAAAAAVGLIGAIAVLAGQVAAGSATLAPPFLSHQPSIVTLALIPRCGGPGMRCRRPGAARARRLTRVHVILISRSYEAV
jgi:hypothetical protein